MSIDDQRTKRRKNIVENFNRLSRAHERCRQTTDGQTDVRRHRTFANKTKTETMFDLFQFYFSCKSRLKCSLVKNAQQLNRRRKHFSDLECAVAYA